MGSLCMGALCRRRWRRSSIVYRRKAVNLFTYLPFEMVARPVRVSFAFDLDRQILVRLERAKVLPVDGPPGLEVDDADTWKVFGKVKKWLTAVAGWLATGLLVCCRWVFEG